MRIVIDIGNTETTIGLAAANELHHTWRLNSRIERTPDEWALLLDGLVTRAGHSPGEIEAACIASVAPNATGMIVGGIRLGMTTKVAMVGPDSGLPLVLDVDEPAAVGADRIANCIGLLASGDRDAIIIDFGTATTFDCVTADRRFIGGAIMPGLRTSSDQLISRAAKLTATELVAPRRAIGRTTAEHIRSGVLFGATDAIDGMVDRIRAEWVGKSIPEVVATGGLASLLAPLSRTIDSVDPDLTLRGLIVAANEFNLPE